MKGKDVIFVIMLLIFIALQVDYVSKLTSPGWDGGVYLENAKNWEEGAEIYQPYRPQLISMVAAPLFTVFTEVEVFEIFKWSSLFFAVLSIVLLYIILKEDETGIFALGVCLLILFNKYFFYHTSQIYTENISLFFLVCVLYYSRKKNTAAYVMAGALMGLTFASRYPIVLQAGIIILISNILRKDTKGFFVSAGAAFVIGATYIATIIIKTGSFSVGHGADMKFHFISTFYLENVFEIFGPVFLLVIMGLFFLKKRDFVYVGWALAAFIFWSLNATNHQIRFSIQWMPAVYYLGMVAIREVMEEKGNE